eukprot:jgi/Mesvir1/8432/Mv03603-RA.1
MVSLFLRVPWGASGARIGRANLASLSIAADVDGVPLQVSAAFSEGNENAPKSSLIFMLGYVYNTIRDAPGGWLMDQPGDHPNLFTFTIPAGSYSLDGVVVNRAITASARLSVVDIVDVPPEEPASDGTIEDLSPHLTAAWFLFVSPTDDKDVRARVPAASLGADGKWALTSHVYEWKTSWTSSNVILALQFSTVRTVSRGSVQAFVWDLMASNVSMAPGVDAFETTGTGKGAITTAYLRLGDIKALSSENGVDVLTSVNNIRVTLPAGLLEVEGVAINKDVRMTWNFDTSPAPTGTIQDLSTSLSSAYLVFQSPTGALYGTVPAASKGADGVWSLNTPVSDWKSIYTSRPDAEVVLELQFETPPAGRTVSRGAEVNTFEWALENTPVACAPEVDTFYVAGGATTARFVLGNIKQLARYGDPDVVIQIMSLDHNNIRVTLPSGLIELDGVGIPRDIVMTWDFAASSGSGVLLDGGGIVRYLPYMWNRGLRTGKWIFADKIPPSTINVRREVAVDVAAPLPRLQYDQPVHGETDVFSYLYAFKTKPDGMLVGPAPSALTSLFDLVLYTSKPVTIDKSKIGLRVAEGNTPILGFATGDWVSSTDKHTHTLPCSGFPSAPATARRTLTLAPVNPMGAPTDGLAFTVVNSDPAERHAFGTHTVVLPAPRPFFSDIDFVGADAGERLDTYVPERFAVRFVPSVESITGFTASDVRLRHFDFKTNRITPVPPVGEVAKSSNGVMRLVYNRTWPSPLGAGLLVLDVDTDQFAYSASESRGNAPVLATHYVGGLPF